MLSEIARFSDRVSGLSAISDHRPCGCSGADVDGDDDGSAGDRLTAVQAGLLCRCGRVHSCVGSTGQKLFLACAILAGAFSSRDQRLSNLLSRIDSPYV